MTAFLMIFRRFLKIFQNCSEGQTNVPEHFPRISENSRKCPKISEDCRRLSRKTRRCFDDFKYNLRDKLGICEIIDVFTCDGIISAHVRISYCFYKIVTTRYTTDFYIIIDHIFGLISHGMSCVIIYEAFDLSRSFIVAVENEARRICSKNTNLVPNYM